MSTAPWQAYAVFLVMGVGWACLSTTAVATTLAPWFERFQGRAVSIASLGASVGGMAGTPILLFGIDRAGFAAHHGDRRRRCRSSCWLPLALFVMKRRPQDLGLLPDGAAAARVATTGRGAAVEPPRAPAHRGVAQRHAGLRHRHDGARSGFVTHQVTLLSPVLGAAGTSITVAATAITALVQPPDAGALRRPDQRAARPPR